MGRMHPFLQTLPPDTGSLSLQGGTQAASQCLPSPPAGAFAQCTTTQPYAVFLPAPAPRLIKGNLDPESVPQLLEVLRVERQPQPKAGMSPAPPRPAGMLRGRLSGLAATPHTPPSVAAQPARGPGCTSRLERQARGLSSLGLAGDPCGTWVAPAGSSPGGGEEGTQSLSAANPARLGPSDSPTGCGWVLQVHGLQR